MALIVPEMLPEKGRFKEQGGCCKSGCSIHLADRQSMEGESKHFLLHLHVASIVQCDTPSRLKANRRHIQKAAGSRARHAQWFEQSRARCTVQAGKLHD